jgi:HK97 family phage major capsid protein
MDQNACFDPSEASIFNAQKKGVRQEILETIKRISLAEFLSKANTTAGAQYLVPDFVSAKIYSSLQTRDIIPLISAEVITPKSDTVTVNVALQNAQVASGIGKAHETVNTVKATITLQKVNANIAVTNDLLEDQDYGLVEWQIEEAAKAIAAKGNNLALTVLKTATDGRGTTVAVNAGSDTTTPAQLAVAVGTVACGAQSAAFPGFTADTAVCTQEAWVDAIATTAGTNVFPPQKPGYDAYTQGLNVIFCNDSALHAGVTSNRMTNCVTVVFSRDYAFLTARKSWGKIENYSKPIEDLAGAVITGRQDSVTMNDDAICALSET